MTAQRRTRKPKGPWTDEKDDLVLGILQQGLSLARGAKVAGYNYRQLLDRAKIDPTGWHLRVVGATKEGDDYLFDKATEHAFEGYPSKQRAVMKDGRPTDFVDIDYKIAHGLVPFVLGVRDPERFKPAVQRQEHTGKDGVPLPAAPTVVLTEANRLKGVLALLGGADPAKLGETVAAISKLTEGDTDA